MTGFYCQPDKSPINKIASVLWRGREGWGEVMVTRKSKARNDHLFTCCHTSRWSKKTTFILFRTLLCRLNDQVGSMNFNSTENQK